MKNDFDTHHLTGEAKKIADAIVEHIRKEEGREPTGGGCRAFYSPEEWKDRGEAYGHNAVLILVHDGGDLAPRCNLSYEAYAAMEALQAVIEPFDCFVEQATGWYSAVYPNQPKVETATEKRAEAVNTDDEYVCPTCGSDEIEIPMWVKTKTNAIVNDYDEGSGYQIFCPKCDDLERGPLVTRGQFDASKKTEQP